MMFGESPGPGPAVRGRSRPQETQFVAVAAGGNVIAIGLQ